MVLGGAAEAAPATGAFIGMSVSLSPLDDYRPPRLPIDRFPKTGFMVVRTAEPLFMPGPPAPLADLPPDLRITTPFLETESDTRGH